MPLFKRSFETNVCRRPAIPWKPTLAPASSTPPKACSSATAIAAPPPVDPAMLELADESRCLGCHDVEIKVRGPAWRDVAKRYRGKPEVEEVLVEKVYKGGGGKGDTGA